MAKKKEEKLKDKEHKVQETEKKTENSEDKGKKAPKPLKPYIHIDTFLNTAIPLFKLSRGQAAGFKSRMNGRHYQRDEQVFVKELKKYLNK